MSVDKSAVFSEIMSNGVDIRNRRIYFGLWGDGVAEDESAGDFSWTSVEEAVRALHMLATANPKKPIELHMSSKGGEVMAMLRLIDEIEACPCQVIFVGGGEICSAATWVMAVCDERRVHKNSQILLHDGWDGSSGKYTDYQVDAKFSKRLQDKLNTIFSENSHMPKEFWQDILQRDVWVSADEAVSLGLVDKVIEPKKRGNLRRTRINHMNKPVDKDAINSLVSSIYERIERKNVTTIQVNIPKKEKFDKDVVIDENSVDNTEFMEPLMKASDEGSHQE